MVPKPTDSRYLVNPNYEDNAVYGGYVSSSANMDISRCQSIPSNQGSYCRSIPSNSGSINQWISSSSVADDQNQMRAVRGRLGANTDSNYSLARRDDMMYSVIDDVLPESPHIRSPKRTLPRIPEDTSPLPINTNPTRILRNVPAPTDSVLPDDVTGACYSSAGNPSSNDQYMYDHLGQDRGSAAANTIRYSQITLEEESYDHTESSGRIVTDVYATVDRRRNDQDRGQGQIGEPTRKNSNTIITRL